MFNCIIFYGCFPADIVQFMKNEVRTKIQSEIIGTESKMGIVDYIAQFDKKRERKDREFDFAFKLNRYPIEIRQIEKIFSMALSVLKKIYGYPAIGHLQRSFYMNDYPIMLEGELGQIIHVARSTAYWLKKILVYITSLRVMW